MLRISLDHILQTSFPLAIRRLSITPSSVLIDFDSDVLNDKVLQNSKLYDWLQSFPANIKISSSQICHCKRQKDFLFNCPPPCFLTPTSLPSLLPPYQKTLPHSPRKDTQLCEACEKLNFKRPTPIQAAAIPEALSGRDIIGLAETGSGKTAAFALPILQALMENPSPLFACVLVPTRELAFQISEQFSALGSVIGVKVATVTGGMDSMSQAIALSKKPHIVVASPGRLLDHLESTKGFSLRTLKYLVDPAQI